MQSTNIRQIKVALREQAFPGNTQVSCPTGLVVAVRKREGQLLAMICEWGNWCPVEGVSIERMTTLADDASHGIDLHGDGQINPAARAAGATTASQQGHGNLSSRCQRIAPRTH